MTNGGGGWGRKGSVWKVLCWVEERDGSGIGEIAVSQDKSGPAAGDH